MLPDAPRLTYYPWRTTTAHAPRAIVGMEDRPAHITRDAPRLYAPRVYLLPVAHGIGGAPRVLFFCWCFG
jgi:hypothetical protein